MARLEGKRALDIGNRARELADQVVEGGALVPPLGKIRAHLDHRVEAGQRGFEGAVIHRGGAAGQNAVYFVVVRQAPEMPNLRFDAGHIGYGLGGLQIGEQTVEPGIVLRRHSHTPHHKRNYQADKGEAAGHAPNERPAKAGGNGPPVAQSKSSAV